ncbi:MAG: zf-HC2 domain-containing protein, partial [Acidimicrobiia bacterium]|nr:zf-HC2 domain-containing protein [Acidimicrobiia bacterium]
MTQKQPHETIEELLGAYALDAVDHDERRLVEDHLAQCSICRNELEEHREVAALLVGDAVEPPPHVWDRIVGQINPTEPREELAPVVSLESKRRPFFSSTRWVAGVAAAAVIGLSAGVIIQSQRIGDLTFQITEQDRQIAALAATLGADPLEQAVTAALSDPADRDGAWFGPLAAAAGAHEKALEMAAARGVPPDTDKFAAAHR